MSQCAKFAHIFRHWAENFCLCTPKRFWTNGDGLILSKNWTNQARPQVSKNVSFLKEESEGGRHLKGHDVAQMFAAEGGEGDVRMSFFPLRDGSFL